MAKGRKTGGRKRGTPNRVTSVAREAFLATFHELVPDLKRWLQETADGIEIEKTTVGPDGKTPVTVLGRLNAKPEKAAELLIRMAEYHYPKRSSVAVTGEDGGPVEFVIRDVAKEA